MWTTQPKIGRGNTGYVYDKFLLDQKLKNKMYRKERKVNFVAILKCISNHNTKATGHKNFNHKSETT